MCKVMTNHTYGTPFDRLEVVNQLFLNEQREPCVNYKYATMIEELQSTSCKSTSAQYGGKKIIINQKWNDFICK